MRSFLSSPPTANRLPEGLQSKDQIKRLWNISSSTAPVSALEMRSRPSSLPVAMRVGCIWLCVASMADSVLEVGVSAPPSLPPLTPSSPPSPSLRAASGKGLTARAMACAAAATASAASFPGEACLGFSSLMLSLPLLSKLCPPPGQSTAGGPCACTAPSLGEAQGVTSVVGASVSATSRAASRSGDGTAGGSGGAGGGTGWAITGGECSGGSTEASYASAYGTGRAHCARLVSSSKLPTCSCCGPSASPSSSDRSACRTSSSLTLQSASVSCSTSCKELARSST
mmetsp:Transcript_52326/g.124907  ORF Transcript_52326/g.124907 Transcript_52326/m.124907 type:complete len:285 (-) Transcript_52326:157-1011(-)